MVVARPRTIRRALLALALGAGSGCADPGGPGGLGPPTVGALAVTVSGLPGGAAAVVTVSGPGGFTAAISGTQTLAGLVPGTYQVTATVLVVAGTTFDADQPVQSAAVVAGATAAVTLTYSATTGVLALAVGGLPAGVAADIDVTGPSGYSAHVVSSQQLTGLPPGSYRVAIGPVSHGGDGFAAQPAVVDVAVPPGATPVAVAANYLLSTGRLSISIGGLPGAAPAQVTVTGPGGFAQQVAGSSLLTHLTPGEYLVTADPVVAGGFAWRPTPSSSPQVVTASPQALQVQIAYAASSGLLQVGSTGLPDGLPAAITVTGPAGFHQVLGGATTLSLLEPGAYQVEATAVSQGGVSWAPSPGSQAVQVLAGVPAAAGIAWTVQPGSLALAVSGVPVGTAASVTIAGPGGYAASVTGTAALTGLTPGEYTITAAPVVTGGNTWAPTPASQVVSVGSGQAAAAVAYVQTTGTVAVAISGLPAGTPAAVTLSGPGGFAQAVASSQVFPGLAPGSYQLTATAVTVGAITYLPAPPAQSAAVSGGSSSTLVVVYSGSVGTLQVNIGGLPAPAASVTVTGPGGFSQVLTATQTLAGLPTGSYQVAAASVVVGGTTYAPTPGNQSAVVATGTTTTVAVGYAPTTGAMDVTITGLPGGVPGSVVLSGPGGATHPVTTSQMVTGLAPGAWTVNAATVSSGGSTFAPAPTTQGVTVAAGGTAPVSVTYALVPPATLNLRIETAYLTQAVQRPDHGVQLVAGRDAYLRVFVVANEANTAQPRVRVRLFHGANQVQSWLLNASSGSVATAVNEGVVAASWNVLVPGALVQPSLALLAEVDPEGLVPEVNEADNSYPSNGTPAPVTVRSLATFQIRMVPVLQSVNSLQGDVSEANASAYLDELRRRLPVGAHNVDVRAVYTTDAPALQSNNANGAWSTILSEILALRNTVDQSTRYYYGVVRTSYGSGIAGIGYVPGSPSSTAKAALGWDAAGSRARVLAHELGHNFGRFHAPCGGAGNPDASYPHTGGQIGAWGLDPVTLAVKAPTTFYDLMGYCPPNEWVSDYTWNAVVDFRAASPVGAPPAPDIPAGDADGMLVWGRITPTGVVLEPTFRVTPTGAPLPGTGAWRVELRDAGNALLQAQAFDPVPVADLPGGGEQHFALVLPFGADVLDRVASVRVTGPQGTTERRAAAAQAGPEPSARAVAGGRRRVEWNGARFPMALIRDAATGEILSFARGGAVDLWSQAASLDLQLSDGVRTERRRIVVGR